MSDKIYTVDNMYLPCGCYHECYSPHGKTWRQVPLVLCDQWGLWEVGVMDADGILIVVTPAQAYVLACILAAY